MNEESEIERPPNYRLMSSFHCEFQLSIFRLIPHDTAYKIIPTELGRDFWPFSVCGNLSELQDRTAARVTVSNKRVRRSFPPEYFLFVQYPNAIFHFPGFCTSALDSARPLFKSPSRWPRIRDRILHAVRIIFQAFLFFVLAIRYKETYKKIASFFHRFRYSAKCTLPKRAIIEIRNTNFIETFHLPIIVRARSFPVFTYSL